MPPEDTSVGWRLAEERARRWHAEARSDLDAGRLSETMRDLLTAEDYLDQMITVSTAEAVEAYRNLDGAHRALWREVERAVDRVIQELRALREVA